MSIFIESITIYKDDTLLVLNKPSGLLSVPGRDLTQPNLLNLLQQVYPDALLVHRLDRDTSGLIIFARSPGAQTHLSKQFAARTPKKVYQALVEGKAKYSQGMVNAPVRYDPFNPPTHIIDFDHPKQALSLYQAFTPIHLDNALLTPMLLQPYTGRSHQLRVHMQHLGHAIVNDQLYNPKQNSSISQLALHSCSLNLLHPVDQSPMMLYCNAPFNTELQKIDVDLSQNYVQGIFPSFPKALLPTI